MKTHSEKLIDILFEDDLSKVLEFTKECAIQDAQRSWGYTQGFDGDIDIELEAPHSGRRKLVLGMPKDAFRSGQERYHAHRAGVPIYETLEDTCSAALSILKSYDSTVVF